MAACGDPALPLQVQNVMAFPDVETVHPARPVPALTEMNLPGGLAIYVARALARHFKIAEALGMHNQHQHGQAVGGRFDEKELGALPSY